METLRIIISAFEKELRDFEQGKDIRFDESIDIYSQRLDIVKKSAPYRQHLLKLFLQYKSDKYVKKESAIQPKVFLDKAKEFYKQANPEKTQITDEDLYDWLSSANKARSFLKSQGIRKYQLEHLKKGKEVTEDKLSEVVDINLLLDDSHITLHAQDADSLFLGLCTDGAILQNLLGSKKFLNLLSRKAFTEGFIKLVKHNNMPALEAFIDNTKDRFDTHLSIKILLQPQNIRMFSSSCIAHFFEVVDFKVLLQQYINDVDHKVLESIYINAPVELFPYMKDISKFMNFVQSNSLLGKQRDVEQIFNAEFSAFKIKMNMEAWGLWGSFSGLTDSTNSHQKIMWFSKIHPVALDGWLSDSSSAVSKTLIQLNNPSDVMFMVERLHGDSIVSILKFFKSQGIKLSTGDDIDNKSRVIAKYHQKLVVQYFEEVISINQDFVKDNNQNFDLQKEINEAMHNVIGSGHIFIVELFQMIESSGIISGTTRTKFQNRFSASLDVKEYDTDAVFIVDNPSIMRRLDNPSIMGRKSVHFDTATITTTHHPYKTFNQQYIPPKVDNICNNWFYVNTLFGALDVGAIGGGWILGYNVHNVFAARHVGANVLAGAVQMPVAIWFIGGGTILSEVLRQGYKRYNNLDSNCKPMKTICPDTGFCVLSDNSQLEPIKCEVGKIECPVLDLY
jgi:hypothetical protein